MQQNGENYNYLFRKQVQLCLFMPGYHPKCWNVIESNKLHGFFFHGVIRIDARWCTWTAFTTHRYHLNNDTFIASGHWQNARVKAGFSSCVKYWNLQRERYTFNTLETKTFSLDLELEIWCCWMSPAVSLSAKWWAPYSVFCH